MEEEEDREQADAEVAALQMQRPQGSYIPEYTDEHLQSIKDKPLPPNFDKTCIVVVQSPEFYNPEHKSADGIVLRSWHPSDIDVLKCLHEDWFPIRYKEAFYTSAVQQKLWNSENPLFTVVATDPSEPSLPPVQLLSEQSNDSTKDTAGCEAVIEPTTKRRNGQETTLAAEKSVLAISPAPLPMPPASKSQLVQGEVVDTGRIIGAVTAQIVHVDECEDVNLYTDDSHTHIMYILTLGVDKTHRRRGISSKLLQQCEDHVDNFNREKQREKDLQTRFSFFRRTFVACGAIYLHVITYNDSAIRFYESNGFKCLRQARNYYLIDGVHYDSLLYIKYVKHPPQLSVAPPYTGIDGTSHRLDPPNHATPNTNEACSGDNSNDASWGWVLARPFVAFSGMLYAGWQRSWSAMGFDQLVERGAIENA